MASIRKRTQWRLVLEHAWRYKTYPTLKQAQADLEAYEAQGLMGLRIERAPGGSWEVRIRSKLAPDIVKSFERRAEADAWAKEREGEIAKRQFVDYREADRNTLGDLLDRYDRERLKGRPKDDPDKVRVRKLREDPLAWVRMSVLQSSDIVKYRDARIKLVKGSTVTKELGALMPGADARPAFNAFMHTLLARRLAAGRLADHQSERQAVEDLWRDPMVNQRWQRLALRLTAADCERIAERAADRGLAGNGVRWLPTAGATDGWALESGG